MSRVTERSSCSNIDSMLLFLLYHMCMYVHMCVCTHRTPPLLPRVTMEEQDWVWWSWWRNKRLCSFALHASECLNLYQGHSSSHQRRAHGEDRDLTTHPAWGRRRSWLHGTSPNIGFHPFGNKLLLIHVLKTMLICIFLWLRILHIFLYVNSCCFFFCEVCVIGPFISWGLWLYGKEHQGEKALMWGSPKPPASTTMWGLHGDQGAGDIPPLLDLPLMMSSVHCTL